MGRSTIKSVPSAVPVGPRQFVVALDCSDRAKAPVHGSTVIVFSMAGMPTLRAERSSREYGPRKMAGSFKAESAESGAPQPSLPN